MNLSDKKLSVIYVDDDRDYLDLFSVMFGKWFDITPVLDGNEALKLLEKNHYEVLISDYEMPGMNGIQLLESVKERSPGLPVILYTGQGNEEIAREAFLKGASDYFTKETRGFAHKEKIVNSVLRAVEIQKVTREKEENEKKYRYIFEHIRDVYYEITLDGIIQVLSPSIEELLKFKKRDLLGKSFYDLFPGFQVREKFINTILKKTVIPDYEIFLKDKTGKIIPCSTNVMLVKDNGGEPLKIIGSLRNISERKRVEENIKNRIKNLTMPVNDANGLTFHDLFDLDEIQKIQDAFSSATGVASIITEPDGRPITVPSNFCRLCKDVIRKTEKGLSNCMYSDAVIGRFNPNGPIMQPCLSGGLWDGGASINVGDKHVANWLIGQVRNDAQNEEQMLSYAREIGADEEEFRSALREVTVMSTEQFQRVCEMLYLIANQMSQIAYQNIQQARFINENEKSAKSLKESEERYRTLVENSPLPIVVQKDGRFLYANSAALKFHELDNIEELLSKPVMETVFFEDRKDLEKILKQIEDKDEKLQYTRRTELRIVKPDGSLAHIDITAMSLNYSGEPADLAIFMDVTERKKMEQELLDKNRELKEFAYRVSHDLKGPVNLIVGFTNIIRENPDLLEQYFGKITRQSEKILHFIDRLLMLSKAGRTIGKKEDLDLNEIIRKKYESSNLNNHSIEMIISSPLPHITADETAIEQLFFNLIDNSIKYRNPDEEKIVLNISHKNDDKNIEISFKDNGIGINVEYLDDIFSPGFVLEKDKNTGFGLAISRSIVEAHGGTIKAFSNGKNCGTEFIISLPVNDIN